MDDLETDLNQLVEEPQTVPRSDMLGNSSSCAAIVRSYARVGARTICTSGTAKRRSV